MVGPPERFLQQREEETLGGLITLVQIDRPDQGLESSRQDGLFLAAAAFFFPFAEEKVFMELLLQSELGQGLGVGGGGLILRQIALPETRESRAEIVGRDQADNRIAQELQDFIITRLNVGLLIGLRGMGQGLPQEGLVAETQADGLFELRKVRLHVCPAESNG